MIPLGKVTKLHGTKGELKVSIFNDESETLVEGLNVWFFIDNVYKSFEIKTIKGANYKRIISLNEIDGMNSASFLIGKDLFVSRSDFPILDNNQFYLNDLD